MITMSHPCGTVELRAISRSLRLTRLRTTAPPTLRETEKPKRAGWSDWLLRAAATPTNPSRALLPDLNTCRNSFGRRSLRSFGSAIFRSCADSVTRPVGDVQGRIRQSDGACPLPDDVLRLLCRLVSTCGT